MGITSALTTVNPRGFPRLIIIHLGAQERYRRSSLVARLFSTVLGASGSISDDLGKKDGTDPLLMFAILREDCVASRPLAVDQRERMPGFFTDSARSGSGTPEHRPLCMYGVLFLVDTPPTGKQGFRVSPRLPRIWRKRIGLEECQLFSWRRLTGPS